MNKWTASGIAVAAAVAAYLAAALAPVPSVSTDPVWLADADGFPKVIAHQGGAQETPAQSDAAFEAAYELGVDIFELDVVLTADERLAVIHDLTVDRTTDGTGYVSDYTYEEIRLLDAGYGLEGYDGEVIRDPDRNPYIGAGVYIPVLEELFEKYPDMPMLIEIKDDEHRGRRAAELLWDLIRRYNRYDSVVVASFHRIPLDHFRGLSHGRVTQSASVDHALRFYIPHALRLHAFNRRPPFEVFNLPVSWDFGLVEVDLTTERLRMDAARRGIAVHYWTINDEETMRELIAMGVDGIITDRPSLLIDIIAGMRSAGLDPAQARSR